MTAITLPTNLSLQDWTDNVIRDLREFQVIGSLTDPEDWQLWGTQLFDIGAQDASIPNPYQFNDWRDWANRVCAALT